MTEKEKLMYDIISKISDMDVPIVFKGALITKLILEEHGYKEIQRMTKDIDANWIGSPPSMSYLRNTISEALGELNEKFDVEESREYGQGRSAGLAIRDKLTGDKVISMDIDIKSSSGARAYYYGEASIKGVLANDILADKISTMSSDAVFKHRAKDMVDVYALTHCVKVDVKQIFDTCARTGRNIQSFDSFFNRKADVEHAYNKLKGIEGKPPFATVYSYLSNFVVPFAKREIKSCIWNPQKKNWDSDEPQRIRLQDNSVPQEKRSSVLSDLKTIKAEQAQDKPDRSHQRSKTKSNNIEL